MPSLASRLDGRIANTLAIAYRAESMRIRPGLRSSQWSSRDVSVVYEAAYLRIFSLWEGFLEDSFLGLMCGFRVDASSCAIKSVHSRSLSDAYAQVLGGGRYLSWWDPENVERRASRFFSSSEHENVMASAKVPLKQFGVVRHRIAHGTDDTKAEFNKTTMQLCARRFNGSNAGVFLKSFDPSGGHSSDWLTLISRDLVKFAKQIAP